MNGRQRLIETLESDRGQGIVIAVSGGSDSVGLAWWLREVGEFLDLRLSIAHLNHGTRGDAAGADADFVARLAESLSLPFDQGEWKPTRSAHFESDARKARYEWLVEIARKRSASRVAVGHTRDDQAETILHRIMRGTGIRGLSGIPRRRPLAEGVMLIRPLLDVSRQEIRDQLALIGQDYREDASNTDLSRTRNRIRHDLLPKLEREYNPAIRDALVRLGQLAHSHQGKSSSFDNLAVVVNPSTIVLRSEPLKDMPLPMRAEVIRHEWRRAGWPEREMNARRWLRLASSLDQSPTRFTITGGIEIRREGDEIRLSLRATQRDEQPSATVLTIPGEAIWGTHALVASFEKLTDVGNVEAIDFEQLAGESFSVRAAVAGDRFAPLGLDGHSQPLNDFFRGRNVERSDRCKVPIVHDDMGIVWVVGHRIADRVKITERTRRVLYLAAHPSRISHVPSSSPVGSG